MRNFLSILAVALVLIGVGNLLTAPAATETHTLDLSYEIVDPAATALPQQPAETQTPTLPQRSLLVSAGRGCKNGQCPLLQSPVVGVLQKEAVFEGGACERRTPIRSALRGVASVRPVRSMFSILRRR